MKTKHALSSAFLLLAGALLPIQAQTQVDPPKAEAIGANTDIKVVTPTNTFYGTRGLTQTGSAEALGEGRLIITVDGAWYQQQQAPRPLAPNNPNNGANIITGIGALSFGLSPYIDVFASLAAYGSTSYTAPPAISSTGSGVGTLRGGIQASLPFDPSMPVRLAAQAVLFQGLSSNYINTYRADGYNYFETRGAKNTDFMVKALQTMVWGTEDNGFKLHLNEGLVTSTQAGPHSLLLLASGVQYNLPVAALGLELNSRTSLKDIAIGTDPLWFTPSVQLRTPYSMNITLGGDVSLSQDRTGGAPRALEPYRLFGAFTFSFDTQADKRARIKEREQREAAERDQLKSNNQGLTNDLAQSDAEVSAARARQKASSDSLIALMSKSQQDSANAANKAAQDSAVAANKARQDSLALINKTREDSLALANKAEQDSVALALSQGHLSDAEKQLLSTGLLLLDACYFETGKTDISINSKPYLNIIAKMLTKYPKLQIEVAGHTDNVGGAAYNMGLSQGRAEAVRAYMVMVAPELSGHLTAKGYGLTQPKADNNTAEGRKLNRRTELSVLNKDALKEYNH